MCFLYKLDLQPAESDSRAQGQSIAAEVSSLTSETGGHAKKLRKLRAQRDSDSNEVERLRQKLAEAEEEMELLRLQAERAALLEVQTEIANKLVEDLEVRPCSAGLQFSSSSAFVESAFRRQFRRSHANHAGHASAQRYLYDWLQGPPMCTATPTMPAVVSCVRCCRPARRCTNRTPPASQIFSKPFLHVFG